MKLLKVLSALLLLTVLTITTNAYQPPTTMTLVELEKFEKNLLEGIKSDNFGLQMSAAYILGELRSRKSIIPLLEILHSNKDEAGRIVAALALYKIGDYKGIYAVKMASKFDDSERVRKNCERFYYEYLKSLNSDT